MASRQHKTICHIPVGSRKAVLGWIWGCTDRFAVCIGSWSGPKSGFGALLRRQPICIHQVQIRICAAPSQLGSWIWIWIFWYLQLRKNRLGTLGDIRNPWDCDPMKHLMSPLCISLSFYMKYGFRYVEAPPELRIHAMVFFELNHESFGVESIPPVVFCVYIQEHI